MIALLLLAVLLLAGLGGELLRRRSSKLRRTGAKRTGDSANVSAQAGFTNSQGG